MHRRLLPSIYTSKKVVRKYKMYFQIIAFLIMFHVIRLTIRSFKACMTMLFSTENLVSKKLIFEEKLVYAFNANF